MSCIWLLFLRTCVRACMSDRSPKLCNSARFNFIEMRGTHSKVFSFFFSWVVASGVDTTQCRGHSCCPIAAAKLSLHGCWSAAPDSTANRGRSSPSLSGQRGAKASCPGRRCAEPAALRSSFSPEDTRTSAVGRGLVLALDSARSGQLSKQRCSGDSRQTHTHRYQLCSHLGTR